MSTYWSYLTNNKNEILTFESHENLQKMILDYKELVKTDFFTQFAGFNKIVVSNKNSLENPLANKLFELELL
jgi:hypothetical protein